MLGETQGKVYNANTCKSRERAVPLGSRERNPRARPAVQPRCGGRGFFGGRPG